MALTVPAELVSALEDLAKRRQASVEQLLRDAIEEYVKAEKALDEELSAWQAAGAEGLALVENDDQ